MQYCGVIHNVLYWFQNTKGAMSVEDIVKQIEQADEIQLNDIISAVIHRYDMLHPDREGSFLSLSTDPHQRSQEMESILRFIRKD